MAHGAPRRLAGPSRSAAAWLMSFPSIRRTFWRAGRGQVRRPDWAHRSARARAGVLRIDLKADGPHFLVAGTTGSGKSELLRTVAAGLAASHPPDRVNLLFIDFKGGSGLGPLTGLPHCVGMLTDLGGAEVERTLVSLRAEVRRREELLARVNAPDLAAYESSPAAGPPVPYLVIIVDEFRILVDEAPGALSELMRIAAIGRSLGVHLIMATQRPQGALNADIRANVTTCIALRVQSDLESIDVMGSGLAAAIPIARAGTGVPDPWHAGPGGVPDGHPGARDRRTDGRSGHGAHGHG